MGTVEVNRTGYLVNFNAPDGNRTYACENLRSLQHLIRRLTGRDWDTFILDDRGLPGLKYDYPNQGGFTVNYPLHIYEVV